MPCAEWPYETGFQPTFLEVVVEFKSTFLNKFLFDGVKIFFFDSMNNNSKEKWTMHNFPSLCLRGD
jgi:hypothetical protein